MPRGTDAKRIYLSVVGKKIIEKHYSTIDKEEAEAYKEKYYPNDENVRVRHFIKNDKYVKSFVERVDGHVEGLIYNLEVIKGEYGQQLYIYMRDSEEDFILQLPSRGNHAIQFVKCIMNADPKIFVKLKPYANEKTGKSGLIVSQQHEQLKYFYTNEEPNGIPAPPDWVNEVDYEDWDEKQKHEYKGYQLERDTFLYKNLFEIMLPKFLENENRLTDSDIEAHSNKDLKPNHMNDDLDKPGAKEKAEAETDLPDAPGEEDDLPF